MLVFELFQHVRIGGVAGFGLLGSGKAQLFKKQNPQLFGRLNIKGAVRKAIDQALAVCDSGFQHFAKLAQLVPVNGNAPAFHPVQHRTQGQLDVPVQCTFPLPFQLLFQGLSQLPDALGTGGGVSIFHGLPQEGGGKLGDRIIRLGGIQVIGGQGRIKGHRIPRKPCLLQKVHGGPGIVQNHLLKFGKGLHLQLHRGQTADTGFPGKAQAAVRGKIQGTQRKLFRDFFYPGQRCHLPFFRNRRLRGSAPETVAVNKPHKFQLLEQRVQLRPIVVPENGIPGVKFNGGLRDDGGQFIRKVGVLPARFQLFPELGANGAVFQMGIDPIQGAEFQQQVCGGFRAHPGNTGDIIRAVPHQGLQVHHALGLKAVFPTENRLVIQRGGGLTGFGDHQLDLHMGVDEL